MTNQILEVDIDDLSTHGWQKNIPDMKGKDWDDFLADIQERGIQEPIRVSNRTSNYVIVDGHQRIRAAKEVELRKVNAIVQTFQDELSEIVFIAGSNKRRHLSDAQKVTIARELEKEFAKDAEVREKAGKKIEDPSPNSDEGSNEAPNERRSDTKAAKAVGLGKDKFNKGKKIQDEAPQPIVEAWEEEEISTHAAHEVTTKAPDPIKEALDNDEITATESIALVRNEEVKEAIESEEITVAEGVEQVKTEKEQYEQFKKDIDFDIAEKVSDIIESVVNLTVEEIMKAINSRTNKELFRGEIELQLPFALERLQEAQKAYEENAKIIEVAA